MTLGQDLEDALMTQAVRTRELKSIRASKKEKLERIEQLREDINQLDRREAKLVRNCEHTDEFGKSMAVLIDPQTDIATPKYPARCGLCHQAMNRWCVALHRILGKLPWGDAPVVTAEDMVRALYSSFKLEAIDDEYGWAIGFWQSETRWVCLAQGACEPEKLWVDMLNGLAKETLRAQY